MPFAYLMFYLALNWVYQSVYVGLHYSDFFYVTDVILDFKQLKLIRLIYPSTEPTFLCSLMHIFVLATVLFVVDVVLIHDDVVIVVAVIAFSIDKTWKLARTDICIFVPYTCAQIFWVKFISDANENNL